MSSKDKVDFWKPWRHSLSVIDVRGAVIGLGAVVCVLLFGEARVRAAEQDVIVRLDQALKSVAGFEYGKDSSSLIEVERIVMECATNTVQRAEVETRLLQTLGGQATRDSKEFVCRQLFTIGTTRCVPQLEILLADPELSHIARFALGRNPAPEAAAALRRALAKTSGKTQAGIINTLGDKKYGPAVPDLAKLLGSSDSTVAEAAAAALGKIGGPDALKVLKSASGKANSDLLPHIQQGLLAGADQSLAGGQRSAAARIYKELYSSKQSNIIRIAALRGLILAQDKDSLANLGEALRGTDLRLRSAAIAFSRDAQGRKATLLLAEALPALPPDAQVALLSALAARNDPAAVPAVIQAGKSDHDEVRIAAFEALGTLGDASSVETMLRAAANSSSKVQPAVRASLVKMQHGAVDATLMHYVESGDPKLQVEAIRAIAGRRIKGETVAPLLKAAAAPDGTVRREAIRALGILVDESSLGALISTANVLKEPQDFESLEQALENALGRIKAPEKQAAPLVAALPRLPVQGQAVVLRLLCRPATPDAFTAVCAALQDPSPSVREAALRSLAEWPNAAPVEILFEQVRSATDPTTKVIALRGCVRVAGTAKDPAAIYARALDLSERVEDKKLVLGALGSAEPVQALKLVEPCLQNEQLRNEAAQAVVQLSDRLRQTDPGRAKAALKQAMAACAEPGIRQKAQDVINAIEEFEDYILDWVVAGPFQQKDKDARALFDIAFAPERQGGTEVKWSRVTKGVEKWDINLSEALGGADDVVAYARTQVWLPAARDARLELGSDDGIKVWLNHAVVHANNTERGPAPRQDMVNVKLNEGWNELLLKVTNRSGGWAFGCRLRQSDGSALEGLKIEAR